MWTEKYRARKFTDLVGDERTHRTVLRWLKSWDPIVFPGSVKPKVKPKSGEEQTEERTHRKILLLTGPPGLGKTTLAHVCARQAGYEVVEINASDERSREVVKGRIRDCLGTENVRGVNFQTGASTVRQAGRPVCVVFDEVDGVVGGSSGSGEGGFMKALIDLVHLDQKNSAASNAANTNKRKRKGDNFRLLRPMVLICNDVYHPALRPLRSSGVAEIVHMHKPSLDKVVSRMKYVFEKEGVKSDNDGVRRLCEATWGIVSRKESRVDSNNGQGDIRGILVTGEWAARKLRASTTASASAPRLTKQWVERHMIGDLSSGGSGARGIGRGGVKEVVDRVFLEGAGFPKSVNKLGPEGKCLEMNAKAHSSVSDAAKGNAISLLRNVVDSCGEFDRVLTDVFTAYPTQSFQDDTFLSKPNAAYEWLHFHDTLSSKVYSGQEWELHPYLSQATLGFHYLFSGRSKPWGPDGHDGKTADLDDEEEPLPFTGPRADFAAHEAHKQNRGALQALQSSLSIPLLQSFRSPEAIATELLPQLNRMLNPDVKPVVVGGSGEQRSIATVRREAEKEMVGRAVEAMGAVGVTFERTRVEDFKGAHGGFIFRMEP